MSRKYAIGQAIPDPISEGLSSLRDALKSRALMQQQQEANDLAKQRFEFDKKKDEENTAPGSWEAINLAMGSTPSLATRDTVNKLRYGGSGMSPEEYASRGLAGAPSWQGAPTPDSGVSDQKGLEKYAAQFRTPAPKESTAPTRTQFKDLLTGIASGNKEDLTTLKAQKNAADAQLAMAMAEGQYNRIDNPGFGGALNLRTTEAVGKSYANDKILGQVDNTINSLNRAQAITNGDIPVTAQTWNIAQQDFINAVAQGGRATEGKVNRELVSTFFDRTNEWLGKGGQISDLRKAEPQLFDQFQKQIDLIKNDYNEVGKNRVYQIGQGHLAAGKRSPDILQASNDTKATYYDRYGGSHAKDTTFAEYQKQNRVAPIVGLSPQEVGKINQKMRTSLSDPRAKDPEVRQQLLDHYKAETGKDYGQ